MRLPLYMPTFRKILGERFYEHQDERMHLFATMMAIYPFTNNEEIQREFMLTKQEIRFWAWLYGIRKNKQYRRDTCIKNGRLQFLKNKWGKKKELL